MSYQTYVVCHGECSQYAWKEHALCCHWVQCGVNVRSGWFLSHRTVPIFRWPACHLLSEGCWALPGSCLPGLGWSPHVLAATALHWTPKSCLLHVSGAPFLPSPLLFLLGPEDSCQLLSDTEVCPSNSANWTWLCWVFPSVCFGRETLKTVNWGNCRAQLIGFPSLRGLYVLLSDVCCLENCCFFYFVWCFPSFCFVE